MRTIICGMGEVGRHLAAELAESGHDVVAIDANREVLEEVEGTLDVMTLQGNAALPETLEKAGAADAHLVAAVTDRDEANLVTCVAANDMGTANAVARLGNQAWFPDRTGWREQLLGVELALCPGLLAGAEVVRLTRAATLDHVENFAGNLLQLAVIGVEEGVSAAGRSATSLTLPPACRALAVLRDGEAEAPESIPHLQPEDRVVIAGPRRTVHGADRLFRDYQSHRARAVVIGGGALGRSVATELFEIMGSVTLADRTAARCEWLSEQLSGVRIARGDGTSLSFLDEIDVRHVDAFVATTGADEVNLMGTLLSKQLGAQRAIALLHRPDYAQVYRALGIEATVSPRLLVSHQIIRFLQRQGQTLESRLADGSVVFELQVAAGSRMLGRRIFDLDLPTGVVTAGVARGGVLLDEPELAPLEVGDVAIVFAPPRAVSGARRTLVRS